MDIECILKREGGTKVTIGKTDYHFAPQPDGAHVADVQDDEHVQRFLGIPEAYKIYRGEKPPAEVKKTAAEPVLPAPVSAPVAPQGGEQVALHGTSVHPSEFEINGRTYLLGDVVAMAHTASGLSVEDWNDLPEAERADMIDAELDKLAADVDGDGDADRDDLVAAYVAKFGKKPHHNLSIAKLREKLAAE